MNTIKMYGLIILYLTLIAISIIACRVKRSDIGRLERSETQIDDFTVTSEASDVIQAGRVVLLRDSSQHNYIIRIVPLDTFSLSLQTGFKGKASSIEFTGAVTRAVRGSDSTDYQRQFETSGVATLVRESELKQSQRLKSSAKFNTTWGLLAMAGLVLACGVWIRN